MRTIHVDMSERDYNRIFELGNRTWTEMTEDERKEYENLVGLVGTKLCLSICRGEQ